MVAIDDSMDKVGKKSESIKSSQMPMCVCEYYNLAKREPSKYIVYTLEARLAIVLRM